VNQSRQRPKQDEREAGALKITTQYRSRQGMIYELECQGSVLDLHVSPRSDSADSGEWCIAAHSGRLAGATTITEWGDTRADALRRVGRAWSAQAAGLGLPSFDWQAVETLLATVRAV
jgi:hypothetical protein